MKHILGIDLETFCEADLKAVGAHRYAEDPSFEVMLFGYAWDDEDPVVVDLTAGEELPPDVLDALYDPDVIKAGWNIAFERACLTQHLGRVQPAEQWEDTMVLASVCGLPLGLGDCGQALKLPADKAKDREGKALIRWFCKPCKPTKTKPDRTRHMPGDYPDKWCKFVSYNGQDVVAERAIRKLLERWRPTGQERRIWVVDQAINDRGIRVDMTLARAAVDMDRDYKARLTQEAIDLTGMTNPGSVAQVKAWLQEQEGIEVASLNKKVMPDVVASLSTDKARQFMAIRKELARSSTAKFDAMVRSACSDGHIRGCFQFCGAGRTGRWAGRRVQLQNLSKNKMDDLEACRALVRTGDLETTELLYEDISSTLSELVRTALIPEEGERFIVCDYSAIEARVLAWIAGEEWALEEFRGKGQIYEATGAMMFHVPKETIAKGGVNHHRRAAAKVAVLASGYGGGVNALLAFGADKMGMSDADMVETVDLWRKANPHVVALWKDLERAAIRCVVRGTPQVSKTGGIRFDMDHGILWMTLPSGRRIAYFGAQYTKSKWKDGKVLSYMGIGQKSHKWERLETWGGKLTENCWGGETPVLTDRGWVPIRDITCRDLLWDGVSWVTHGGVVHQGWRPVICLDGLTVTSNHKILTTEGWRRAEACNGLDRLSVQLPDGPETWLHRGRAWTGEVGCAMPVRKRIRDGHSGFEETGEGREADFLWLHETKAHLRGTQNTRNDEASGIRRLEVHEGQMRKPETPGLEELRRAWDHSLRTVGKQLRKLLGRYGANLRARSGFGPQGQQFGVFPGELPLGQSVSELPEQEGLPSSRDSRRPAPAKGISQAVRGEIHNTAVSAGARLSAGEINDPGEREKPVYDILNAGPRHRYVVLGSGGPILAHNCVQATARDCLRDAMVALSDAGFQIRAHIHDEVVISEPIYGRTLEDVAAIMGRSLPWAPGLPLRGDGYYGSFYFKD